MRSAKRVTLSLLMALTLPPATTVAQAEQPNPDKAPHAQLSGTRWASCVVTITVDPAIMALQGRTIQALVLSSDVAGQAAHRVLKIDDLDSVSMQNLVQIEPLSEDSQTVGARPKQPSAAPGAQYEAQYEKDQAKDQSYDAEMLRQMEEIYGNAYTRQMVRSDSRRSPSGPSGDQALVQRASLRLTVDLPGGDPVAKEFLQALVENLRTTLLDAYAQRVSELNALLRDVESRRRALETGPGETDTSHPEEEQSVQDRLDRVVDLSVLQPAMPVSEAVDILRKSVDPSLQIVVLWRDLEQNAEIAPTSPIDIDGMANVRVRTALEVLLKALGAGRTTLSYQIKGSVITVGTAQTLGGPAQLAAEPGPEANVGTLAARKHDLMAEIQALQLDLATMEARQKAIEKQIAIITDEAAQKADQDEITRELDSLVKISTMNMVEVKKAVDAGRATPADMSRAQESLTRAKIELARRREELSKAAGGGQVEEFNRELSQMTVEKAGKLAQQDVLNQQLAGVERELARASAFNPAAARMRIVREALDIMARRMAELQTRLANLQPPTVTMIGAN
jgi:hypothetical protein